MTTKTLNQLILHAGIIRYHKLPDGLPIGTKLYRVTFQSATNFYQETLADIEACIEVLTIVKESPKQYLVQRGYSKNTRRIRKITHFCFQTIDEAKGSAKERMRLEIAHLRSRLDDLLIVSARLHSPTCVVRDNIWPAS